MMMKLAVSMVAFMGALTWAWPVWAQPDGGPGGPGGFRGRGGGAGLPQLTQEQQAAIRALNEASAPLAQAVNEARNALNTAVYAEKPDQADIKAKVEKLAAAELASALARAEAFAKLQASPNKLNLPPQQLMMILGGPGGGFGGRGGFGRGQGGFGGGGGRGGRSPGLEAQEAPGADGFGGGRGRGRGGPGGSR